jgi:hypothetical protein
MIKSGKERIGETEMQVTIRIQDTSLCQSAEWGMRAIQGSFPRLKDWMIFFRGHGAAKSFFTFDCHVILNFQTLRVGLNQLSLMFSPKFEAVGDDSLDVIPNLSEHQLLQVTFNTKN